MERIASLVFIWLVMVLVNPAAPADSQPPDASRVLERCGAQQGVCAVLGQRPTELAISLAEASELAIYLQLPDADQAEAARRTAADAGLLGRRVFVEQGPGSQLHLADNLADAVVVQRPVSGPGSMPESEILRVLRPGGKALIGSRVIVKPAPEGTDDWSHPYHGPDNNPQSQDRLARAPYLTHFLAEPWYSPMPLVTVASGGRLFKAFGHIAIKQREWPLLNTLVAQSAYNGTILWQRKLSPNFMIHRSALVATPETLFLADDASCKLLDAASGEVQDEIVLDAADGPVWKWLALADGVLYALAGADETPDPTIRGERRARGWPWGPPLGRGYNSKNYPWGFGRTILAIDPQSKRILWRHRSSEPLDARAQCMAAGRLFYYSHGKFLGALDASSGKVLWETSDADVLQAVGEHRFAQNPTEGFSTSAYVKCSEQGLYFAGPTRTDLVAVSAANGKLLWRQAGGGNSQLVLRSDGLYAMGPRGSAKYDYLSGSLLAQIGPRVNCTRATGSADSIFVRGGRDGTMRYDLVSAGQQHLSPMRPSCQDGVLVADGHLFWGPWMCDCNINLVGVVSLAPAGDFAFDSSRDAARLQSELESKPAAPLEIAPSDWPAFRANNVRSAFSPAAVPGEAELLWTYRPSGTLAATPPITAGGMVFAGRKDGTVTALDAATGKSRWTACTGGPIFYPPALWEGRALVGSGDGWIYCFEAATGRRLWRFRAAPADRIIPVYGSLLSTWPVASGVLVEDGVAYAAAGIANHDGTHVYALDAATGEVHWHNSNSGSIDPQTGGGVSVNGHLLLNDQRLYLAGGNVVPVAEYDTADGRCLAQTRVPNSHTQFTAGADLFLIGQHVQAGGPPLHSPPGDYRLAGPGLLQTSAGDVAIGYGPHDGRVGWFESGAAQQSGAKPRWQAQPLNRSIGAAVTPGCVLVTGLRDAAEAGGTTTAHLVALDAADGQLRWSRPLPADPVPWGLAIDREGRVLVSLNDGSILCYASTHPAAG